jgi:predicted outer membrane repeat protein
MRFLPIVLLNCAAVFAQESLTTTFANNNGGTAGGAVYFTLTVAGASDITITDIDFNFSSPAGSIGSVDIYTFPGGHAGNELLGTAGGWVQVATCPIAASNAAGTPTNGVLSTPLTILAGTAVGVAYVDSSLGTAHAYTSGSPTLPLSYAGCGLSLDAGTASNTPFTGGIFSPRVVNTTINYSTTASCSLIESIGDGCTSTLASIYEDTTLDVWALNNTLGGIDYISTGSGYIVTAAAGTFVPVGTVDPLTLPIPGIADDSVNPVGSLGLEFSSNGFLALGAGNTNAWSPTVPVFLDQPAAMFTCWADFQPNSGGDITYEEAGTRALLTYTDVLSWGTADMNTFQFDIDMATGSASLYFGAMASTAAHPMFVGYSPGGPNADPGSTAIETQLAAIGGIILAETDTVPLTLAGVGRPVMGAATVPYEAITSNIEAGAIFHVGVVGLSNPGLPLSLIGFPNSCTLYAQGDALVGPAVVAGGPGDLTWTVIGLPVAAPAFNGVELYAAVATLDLSLTSSTSRSSNGIKLTLGDL